jgi:hypothetical protein
MTELLGFIILFGSGVVGGLVAGLILSHTFLKKLRKVEQEMGLERAFRESDG